MRRRSVREARVVTNVPYNRVFVIREMTKQCPEVLQERLWSLRCNGDPLISKAELREGQPVVQHGQKPQAVREAVQDQSRDIFCVCCT